MPFLNSNHTRLYYQHVGKPGQTPILFIHPPLLTSEVFYYQREQLNPYYQLITFDIRGHGQSQPSSQTLTYSLVVEDMLALLDHLEIDRAYLCGYSTGGSIALEALLSAPKRFIGAVLLSAMSESTDPYLRSMLPLASFFSHRPLFTTLLHVISWSNSDTGNTFHRLYNHAEKGDPQNIRQYYQYSRSYNCTHRLKEIQHPNLLLYGGKDPSFHGYSTILHERLPNNQRFFIPHVKHQLPTKAHNEVNRQIKEWIL